MNEYSMHTVTCGELRASDDGKEVVLTGWAWHNRDHGGLIFIDLRDRTGYTQIVVDPDCVTPEDFAKAEHVGREYVLKVAGNKLSSSNKAHIKFTANDNIKMNKVSVFNRDMDTPDQVVNKLTYMTDIEVSAVAICQDGKLMTIVENKQAADDVIKRIKESYQTPNEGMKITKTDFETPVDTKEVQVMLTSVGSKGDALHDLTEGGTIEIRQIVNEGETVNSIAKEFNVSPSDIKDMETGETVSKAESGSRVRIQKKIDPLKVITIEKGTTT
ncbi:MAG: hypothetical protein HUJ76_12485, partial [Parasporobacterium sp.]|nr:hypothetical protein [Parasporobacterium sp.]